MPNTIKYTTGSENLALKSGNFYIGTGDVDKGPTSSTGYYNGITPPSNGYTIYLNKESQGPSIYIASNDSELINITNSIADETYTTVQECLIYYNGQSDKMVFNRNYEGIVTDGLMLNLDAGFTSSYPTSGNTWYDISLSGNNGTLINGPTYNGGSIVFDGIDDYVKIDSRPQFLFSEGDSITVESWVKCTNIDSGTYQAFFTIGGSPDVLRDRIIQMRVSQYTNYGYVDFLYRNSINTLWQIYRTSNIVITENEWVHIVGTLTYGNGSTWRIYINGVNVPGLFHSGDGNAAPIQPEDVSIYLGPEDGDIGAEYFTGNISMSRLYNRALSAQEVLQNYNAMKDRFIPPTSGIVTDSLFMKLDASNYTSGTWSDETGNGNNATINGATWSSTDGGIFDFDGSNDTISIAHTSNLSLSTTEQRTIQVWVKFDTLPALNVQVPVFGKLSSSFGFDGYWGGLFSNGGQVRVTTNGTAIQRVTTSTLTVTTNTWYLFTFISQITSTANTTKVYINENEYGSTAHGSDGYTESNPLYLGYIGSGVGSQFLNGKIGACYFYTKGLNATEISDNYNATKGRFGL